MANPIVGDLLSHQRYVATRDDCVRSSHFTPPLHFNCRCIAIPITLEQAADWGVGEARRWLESGFRPVLTDHRYSPGRFPIEPNSGWGHRGRVGVMA